jgi:hypothetical protein
MQKQGHKHFFRKSDTRVINFFRGLLIFFENFRGLLIRRNLSRMGHNPCLRNGPIRRGPLTHMFEICNKAQERDITRDFIFLLLV